MSRRLFALFALLFVVLACSSAPKVPTVDTVTVGAFTKAADGSYSGSLTITAHGDGSAVSQLAFHVPPQNGVAFADSSFPVAGKPSPYQFILTIPAGTPAGTYTFQVTAVDGANAQSAPFSSSLTLP